MGHKSESYTIECKFLWDDGYIIAGSEDGFVYIYNVLEVFKIYSLLKDGDNIWFFRGNR